jgi:small-conductance mechanosensitive channel
MPVKPALDFSWGFLTEISWWSIAIALVLSFVATVVTGQLAFALGCLLAASVDFAFVRATTTSARREIERGQVGATKSSILFVARLGAKAGLLGLSVLFPHVIGFAGTVVGVLAFDLTLAVVGSVIAATRVLRGSRMGR